MYTVKFQKLNFNAPHIASLKNARLRSRPAPKNRQHGLTRCQVIRIVMFNTSGKLLH